MELGAAAVPCGKDKFISRNELLLHLKTYNIYYEGQNLQLRHREEEGELIVEGLLNISWGLRRPIRLQMQDDNQRIRPPPSSSSWHSGCNLGAHGSVLKPSTLPDIQVTDGDSGRGTENPGNGAGELGSDPLGSGTSVFTPAYGSVTNVRINSTMTTPQVLKLLLNKFKIENSAEEFALYMVHTSGGECPRSPPAGVPQIPGQECPRSPCTSTTLAVPVPPWQCRCPPSSASAPGSAGTTLAVPRGWGVGQFSPLFTIACLSCPTQVAQYIKFEMPILRSFIQKLEEEEDREVKKLKHKYSILRLMIEQRLEEISEGPTAM
ncbi:ras association domain-containing protein 2 [Onychostruthus taczanowskii]|uniref:ras association domain-containing protein 2 n=1 Tax=Onychostruthus taczanowskii TaxID=356909 RepID=UPI001B801BD0|nr:ras association domain-containing protein 2 [Onychostruthus taczanowskii]